MFISGYSEGLVTIFTCLSLDLTLWLPKLYKLYPLKLSLSFKLAFEYSLLSRYSKIYFDLYCFFIPNLSVLFLLWLAAFFICYSANKSSFYLLESLCFIFSWFWMDYRRPSYCKRQFYYLYNSFFYFYFN
jgi:hypothetical protein